MKKYISPALCVIRLQAAPLLQASSVDSNDVNWNSRGFDGNVEDR